MRAITSVVNRYYDPTTDQFLSIDPDVETTNQPYVFTNDNPLNAEDPLGLEEIGVGFGPASDDYGASGGGVGGGDGVGGSDSGGDGGDGGEISGEENNSKGGEEKGDNLNEEQQKNLKRFEKSLPSSAEDVKVTKLPNGDIKFEAKVPANNVPGSYTEYVKIVNSEGVTDDWYHDTYDANGDFVHRHY